MTVVVDDTDFTLYLGDVRQILAQLEDEAVHCVVTSPPYWGLRDYGTGVWDGGNPNCDHSKNHREARAFKNSQGADGQGCKSWTTREDQPYADVCGKCGARRVDQQLGLEPTTEQYVTNMVNVFREVRRVLRRDGTLFLNLGDCHANKQLQGIPWKLAFALQTDGWYLRADIIWAKPNPMPESVTDRPTKAHEYVFLLTRSPRYFFDQEAVREPIDVEYLRSRYGGTLSRGRAAGESNDKSHVNGGSTHVGANPAGRNVRSVWEIATQPYAEAHFATFPEALVERCIKAGTSERGCCPECGAPWQRKTDVSYEKSPVHGAGSVVGRHYETGANNFDGAGMPRLNKRVETTGWRPNCNPVSCPAIQAGRYEPVPCTVLDPFMGSGTTALVARRLGRRTVGIELNPTYAQLNARRLQQLSLLAPQVRSS